MAETIPLTDEEIQTILELFPSAYSKDPSNEFGKVLNLILAPLFDLENEIENVEEVSGINGAYGEHLDKHGENVEQLRGGSNDDLFKLLIRSKIRSNLSAGDVNSLLGYIAAVLQIPIDDVSVIEPDWNADSYEAASFEIRVPYNTLSNLLVTIKQFIDTINKLTAAGVRVALFGDGTFVFASQKGTSDYTPELDSDDSDGFGGFSDLNQSTGGSLGAVYDPEKQSIVI